MAATLNEKFPKEHQAITRRLIVPDPTHALSVKFTSLSEKK
jgi:hypothetical protein